MRLKEKKTLAKAGARSFNSYIQLSKSEPLPKILMIHFCDWADIETTYSMTWIISSGLKAGIHLFIVANRMSDKNLSPNIKANIPNRAVFTLTSAQDSRLSGVNGAETLKEGETLYKKGNVDPKKLTTIFTPEANVKEVVEVLKKASTHA